MSTLRTLRVSKWVFDIKTLLGGLGGLPHLLNFFFFTYFQIYIKSIENLYKIYRTDLLSRKFHLGDLCMPRHKAFDNTMLIRLTSELKSSFNSVCDSKGLTPSDEIRRLIVEYVTQNLNKGISAKTGVEDDVNDDNLDLFPSAASKAK